MPKIKSVLCIYASAVLTVLASGGCNQQQPAPEKACEIIDHGNGVHFFCCEGAKFGRALSEFRRTHPNIQTISGNDGVMPYGKTYGFWVITND